MVCGSAVRGPDRHRGALQGSPELLVAVAAERVQVVADAAGEEHGVLTTATTTTTTTTTTTHTNNNHNTTETNTETNTNTNNPNTGTTILRHEAHGLPQLADADGGLILLLLIIIIIIIIILITTIIVILKIIISNSHAIQIEGGHVDAVDRHGAAPRREYRCYTRSPLEDSRLFGPSPWTILATTCEQKRFLSNPAPGENLLSGNLVMETGCTMLLHD